MALAKDESTGAGRGRVVDSRRDLGVTLYRSDFDTGFDNWTDHWQTFTPSQPISLSSEAAHTGSRSLMLATNEGAYDAAQPGYDGLAFKRQTIFRPYRYYSFSGYFALGMGGYTGTWQSWALLFDIQKQNNTTRSIFRASCDIRPTPDFARWHIEGDTVDITVPASTLVSLGDNENKKGFQYARLTIDTQANGGLGGYHELQVNQSVFNLTALGGGSGSEAPQFTADAIDNFAGGFNLGLQVIRSTTVAGGCQLFADELVLSAVDTWPTS